MRAIRLAHSGSTAGSGSRAGRKVGDAGASASSPSAYRDLPERTPPVTRIRREAIADDCTDAGVAADRGRTAASATWPTCSSGTLDGGIPSPASAGWRPGWSGGPTPIAQSRRSGGTRCCWSARPPGWVRLAGPARRQASANLDHPRRTGHLDGAGRPVAGARRRPRWPARWPLATWRRPVRRSPHLVGRDPAELDASRGGPGLRRVGGREHAPTPWSRRCSGERSPGCPGCWATARSNTLDAMVGHRIAALPAVRLGGGPARRRRQLGAGPGRRHSRPQLAAPLVGGSPTSRAAAVVRHDAGRHPSPNAGVVEAAFAGALGIRLGGRNVYRGQVEERGVLGEGPRQQVADDIAASEPAGARQVSLTALALAMLIRSGRR